MNCAEPELSFVSLGRGRFVVDQMEADSIDDETSGEDETDHGGVDEGFDDLEISWRQYFAAMCMRGAKKSASVPLDR